MLNKKELKVQRALGLMKKYLVWFSTDQRYKYAAKLIAEEYSVEATSTKEAVEKISCKMKLNKDGFIKGTYDYIPLETFLKAVNNLKIVDIHPYSPVIWFRTRRPCTLHAFVEESILN